ncbi:MAG TPA: response regulator [Candidatus Binatia bacterium]|jgi:CheY-like chemotaxis protein
MNGIKAAIFHAMGNQKKVLIVDDDTGCRELLVMIAEKLGYSALQAADGIEALDQASQRHPDLIFMDLLMPRMSGDEATALLKAKLPTKNIPIVICTALSEGPQTTAALDAGAEEILQKPIGMSVIRGALQRYAPTAV